MQPCTVNKIQVGNSRPVLMGIINISPESFFSGSYVPDDQIRCTAEDMITHGADIIDIGARSTAPGSRIISVNEEKERLTAALKTLDGTGITVSVDTMYPEVLEAALTHDIHMANDISGLLNPEIAQLIADAGIPAILMTANQTPGDCCNFEETMKSLHTVTDRAMIAGVQSYILDPGVGRWIPERTPEADFEICRRFQELSVFDRPLLAAISRKTFLGSATGKNPEDRLAATLAVTAGLVLSGAAMIRTHDIPETMDLINVITALQAA
ncbi:MAG: dihydropteroate synthase [Methanospirillum sp.]|uniref:dihydropteroate synthase n=1 Tax=Methanospirillum sp. TaxID=45200 RepID=UPI00236F64E3|nr:dihydropteroate synthase [Methanospirillum sp.]MDD1728759.1 dihydropteroate synthase [Methanospirillum sp.]